MNIEQQETIKNEFSTICLKKESKLKDIKFIGDGFHKNFFDNKIENIYGVEDAILNVFPSSSNDEFNTEYMNDKRIYEITSNTEIKPKKPKPKRNNNHNHRGGTIFKIKKITKILGRRKLNQPQLYSSGADHTKFGEDNIVRKIKIYFINSTMSYINQKYIEFTGKKSKSRLLGQIKPNFTIANTKKENQEYLSKKIKNIFSEKLSTKCKRYPNNYNQKQIAKIIEKGKAQEIISILNTSVKDMYEKYIDEINIIPGYNLIYDLQEIEKRNGKEYAEIYKNNAMNLIEILNKKGRKD